MIRGRLVHMRTENSNNTKLFATVSSSNRDWIRKEWGDKKLIILGDSHVGPLYNAREIFKSFTQDPLLLVIRGATIAGFGKRQSSLDTFSKLNVLIEEVSPEAVVLKLGQVDVDLGQYYRATIKNEDIKKINYFDSYIDDYLNSIALLPQISRYFVCTINLPTLVHHKDAVYYTSKVIHENIADKPMRREKVAILRQIMPSIEDRTQMTIAFNQCLTSKCKEYDIPFIDETAYFLDEQTGLVKEQFRSTNDHHYACSADDKHHCIKSLLTAVGFLSAP